MLGERFLNGFGKTEEEMIADQIIRFGINELTDKDDIVKRSLEAGMNLARRNDYFEMVAKYGNKETIQPQIDAARAAGKSSGKTEAIVTCVCFVGGCIILQKIAGKVAGKFDEKMEENRKKKAY